MSLETMTKLATYTLGSSSSTITFDNIPQTYTDLKLMVSARGDTTNSDIAITGVQTHYLRINGNLGTLHSSRYIYGNGATATSGTVSGETIWRAPGSTNASDTASTFSSSELYIAGYARNTYKSAVLSMVTENNATTAGQFISAFVYAGTEPITKIEVLSSSGNYVANSTFTLYGVKAMRTAVGNSIKATGGNISFDGTYVVHTFNSTGVFTPTAPVLVDYLVVAGGGGGGNRVAGNGGGGGGGAGGLRTSVGLTQMLVNPYSYTVTVGAGGAINASGSNSSFSTISSTGGGYGGNNGTPYAGASGGSGGGSIRSDSGITVTGGSGNVGGYSPVEGYAGGSGSGPGGGGGGAGAVGTNSGSGGGTGGIGVANSISGTSTYYAGGGGGAGSTGNAYSAGAGGLGGGGQGGGLNMTPVAGTANTGGGGGGQQFYPNTTTGGAGGSGMVIIRYKA